MKHFALGWSVLCAAALAVAPAARADAPDPLKVSLTANRIVSDARGRETLGSAEQARPGETVEYRATYTNASRARLGRVLATVPIPDGTEYQAHTAKPAATLASVDGKTFEPLPLKRRVRLPDGREETRDVPLAEYRYLRWSLGSIEAGAGETVRCRVRIAPLATAATSAAR